MAPVRSLLLGCAVALSTGAQAADLPAKAAARSNMFASARLTARASSMSPAPTAACASRGRVRADYLYVEPFNRARRSIGFRARGRLNIDHRTATAYGLLRTYIRYEIDRNSGTFTSTGRITHQPAAQAGLHPVRRPHRRSRHVVLLGLRTCRRPTSATCASTTRRTRRISRLHLLVRQRLLGDPVARGRARTSRQQHARVPAVRRRRGDRSSPRSVHLCRRAVARCRRATCAMRAIGAACSSPARCTRSATSAGLPPSTPSSCPCSIRSRPAEPAFADTDYGFAVALNGYSTCRSSARATRPGFPRPTRTARSATSTAARPSPSQRRHRRRPLGLPFADAFINPFTGNIKTTKALASPAASPTTGRRLPVERVRLVCASMLRRSPASSCR